MNRTTLLVAALLLAIVVVSAVFFVSPLSATAAFSVPQAYGEMSLLQAVDALAIPDLDVSLPSTPTFTVALPVVFSGYRYRPPCSPESPFSIEIAAMHQVVPDKAWAAPERALAEADWQQKIQAGFPTLVKALADSGACWTRVELNWAQIQPDPPPAPYQFSYFDERLQMLVESGVQVVALVHRIPKWAGAHSLGPIYPERMDEFSQFLTDLVNRYKGPPYNIHHWELFNEPDLTVQEPFPAGWGFNGYQYARMLDLAYPAIKAADPSATVLMGGLAYDAFTEYGLWFYRYFPDEVMASGGGDSLDVTNFHYFPDYALEWERWNTSAPPTCGVVDDGLGPSYEAGGIDVIAKISHFRNRLRVCYGLDKPIWITELGEHGNAGDPNSLEQQARYVFQGYARALAEGVENITWFALVSPPYDPNQQGLLYDDWSPKPAFYAYQTLTNELAGYHYSHALNVPNVEGYAFRDGSGHEKVMAWTWGEAGQPAYLTFDAASELRVVDRWGQVTLVRDGGMGDEDGVQNGSVRLRLPAPPVDPLPSEPPRFTAEPYLISK